MSEPNLLLISLAAFTAVFLLLSLLAGTIRVLTALFPAEVDTADTAVVAAITAAAARTWPGRQVTRIEEIR
jgi:hypothetical protein